MTSPPPLPSFEVSLEHGDGLRQAVAWVLTLACVGLAAWGSQKTSRWSATKEGGGEQAALPFQVTMQGRYLVGVHRLLTPLGQGMQPAQTAQGVQAIESATTHPREKLAVVPIVAELEGAAAARQRLTALRGKLDNPEAELDAATLDQIYDAGLDKVSSADRAALVAHYGWFGQLALTWQQPDDEPGRKALLNEAQRTAISLIVLILLILGGLVTGVALLIMAINGIARGRIWPRYRPPVVAPVRYLEAFTLYLLGMIALSLLIQLMHWHGLWPSFFLPLLPPLALAWPAFRRGAQTVAREVGWSAGGGVLREMGSGIVGYITGMPIVAVGMLASVLLAKLVSVQPSHPVVEFAGRGPSMALQMFLLACIVAPLVEETMFRGALYHHLRGRFGWVMSAVIVGILFAAVHPQGWTTIPALGAIGFVLAGIREWRNSLVASMTAHALNNGVVCIFLICAVG